MAPYYKDQVSKYHPADNEEKTAFHRDMRKLVANCNTVAAASGTAPRYISACLLNGDPMVSCVIVASGA